MGATVTNMPGMLDCDEQLPAESARCQRLQRYELAASGSSGGVWDWDIVSGEVFYAPRFIELLSYDAGSFPNTFEAWERKIHPDDLARVRMALENHLQRREPYCVEYRIKSRSGEYLWFETCGQALWDEAGEPIRMAGSNLDIHTRKLAEERLQRLSRLHAVSSSIHEAIVRIREPHKLYEEAAQIAVEKGLLRMAWVGLLDEATSTIKPVACSGMDCGYLRSITISVLEGPEGRGPAGRAFRTGMYAISNDIESDSSFLSKERALERGYLSCAAFPLKLGGKTVGLLTMYAGQLDYFEHEEISVLNALAENMSFAVESAMREQERQQAEQALREKDRMISTLLSNLPGGAAYRARPQAPWPLEFISQGGAEMTGVEPAALLGSGPDNFRSLIHPDDLERVHRDVTEALANRRPFEITYRIHAQDGKEKSIWERGQGLFSPDGSVLSLEGFMTDVTEKLRLESHLLRAQRMDSIGTLAGGIAHDLNNVLTPILISLSLLRMKLPNARDVELLNTLEASAQRGASMVQQILSFARGEDRRSMLLRPKDVIREIENLIIETFPKSICFKVIDTSEELLLEGDPTQLHQVLLNLCVNARDAMPAGGTLEIKVGSVEIDSQFAAMHPEAQPGTHLVIEVRDTGMGIAPEVRDRIFDPFFTTKGVGAGTGLGLSSSLGIVKSHHGFIELASHPGKGTSFSVYLPARTTAITGKPAEDTGKPAPAYHVGQGELIMVVDDEQAVRTATTYSLETFGYQVITACNGADAIATFLKHDVQPAAIITDMMMPVMDGPTMIQALLKLRPGLPIIAASGLNNHMSAKALSLGSARFLLKPYHCNDLLGILHELLHEKEPVLPV